MTDKHNNKYDDGSGIIKNIGNFKFYATVTYKEISDVNIVFEWLNNGAKKTMDFGPVENFNLISEAEAGTFLLCEILNRGKRSQS